MDECKYLCRAAGGCVGLIVSFSFLRQFYVKAPGLLNDEMPTAWWQELRLLHSVSYSLAGIMLWSGGEYTWIVLLIDVVLGVIACFINFNRQQLYNDPDVIDRLTQ